MSVEASPNVAPIKQNVLWLSALLPALVLCLFGPASIYQANPDEFDSPVAWLLPLWLAAGLGVTVILVLLGYALPTAARIRWVSLLFITGVLLWFQGAFLMHDYGVLDGRGMRLEGFGLLVSSDFVLWGAVLAGALAFAKKLAPLAGFGSAVFIGLQAVPFVAFLLSLEGEEKPSGPEAPAGIFQYAEGRNIVHVVLDNFQTDVFEQVVDEESLRDRFDGFTLFRNNLAVAPHTSLAIPAIFSGRAFDGSIPADEYYQQAIREGFHTRLESQGTTVNLVPLLSMRESRYSHYFEPPSIYDVSGRERAVQEAVQLFDIALFRHLPHRARMWVYNDNRWRLRALVPDAQGGKGFHHRRFLADYIERIRVEGEKPAYHYVHLWPPHPPFTTLENGRPAQSVLANTRENYVNEARPTVALMVELIERLKALDIYDDALVIFQSDHGGGYEPEFMPRRSLALLAVKPPGKHGPMATSEAPSAVTDVAATVLKTAGIDDPDFSGPSLFSLDAGERLRHFVFKHEGAFYITEIRGHVADPKAYAPPRRLETVSGSRRYEYGEAVEVGLVGQGGRFLSEGWSAAEDRHVWSNGPQASLLLEVAPPESDLELRLVLVPYVHAEALPEQRIEILVNGELLTTRTATEPGRMVLDVKIPRDRLSGSELDIGFRLPNAASPADLGTGGDRRELGIGLIGFRLQPVESRPAG